MVAANISSRETWIRKTLWVHKYERVDALDGCRYVHMHVPWRTFQGFNLNIQKKNIEAPELGYQSGTYMGVM